MRKDQARRLRYQEKQRLLQRAEKDLKKSEVLGHCEPSKGTLESYSRILVK